jgi:hypothetical protein
MLKPTPMIHRQDGRPCISLTINQKPVKSRNFRYSEQNPRLIKKDKISAFSAPSAVNKNPEICEICG